MTAEKIIFITLCLISFIITISFHKKSYKGFKSHIFPAILFSSFLGISSLLAVWGAGFIIKPIIALNLCTITASVTGSIPAVISMLFFNIL